MPLVRMALCGNFISRLINSPPPVKERVQTFIFKAEVFWLAGQMIAIRRIVHTQTVNIESVAAFGRDNEQREKFSVALFAQVNIRQLHNYVVANGSVIIVRQIFN